MAGALRQAGIRWGVGQRPAWSLPFSGGLTVRGQTALATGKKMGTENRLHRSTIMRRIAIWNTAFLGDAALTLPLVRAVAAAWPDAAVDM